LHVCEGNKRNDRHDRPSELCDQSEVAAKQEVDPDEHDSDRVRDAQHKSQDFFTATPFLGGPVPPSRLERKAPPEDPGALLQYFDFGLATQEVAALMTRGNDRPDGSAAEAALLALVYEGRAERHALGGDALWMAADRIAGNRLAAAGATSSA
jgi:hypothetical protein